MITHQFCPGDFGTCRCGAGLGDPIHWGATVAIESRPPVCARCANPTYDPYGNCHKHADGEWSCGEVHFDRDPVRTDDVLEAQNTALRKALIACRALHTGAEFMKGEAQRTLWMVDAVIEETR